MLRDFHALAFVEQSGVRTAHCYYLHVGHQFLSHLHQWQLQFLALIACYVQRDACLFSDGQFQRVYLGADLYLCAHGHEPCTQENECR